jgi:dTDP-4-amino-4,6-dideoxygalactose transaminase
MNEIHAIAALDQLTVLDDLVAVRNEVAEAYGTVVAHRSEIAVQQVVDGNAHSYVHWAARVPNRDEVAARMSALGVATKPYFPAQHRTHPVLSQARLPVTEYLHGGALAFPTSSELTPRQIDGVCEALARSLPDTSSEQTRGVPR